MRTKFLPLLAVGIALLCSTACEKLKARDELNKGVQAFKSSKFPEAAEHFTNAINYDPTYPTSRLYLAMSYLSQWIPGAISDENTQMAAKANEQFLKVLEQNPKETVAIASIASMYFNQKKLDEAKEWYTKLLNVDPNDKSAYYTMGVIAWTKTFPKRMEARNKLSMKPEDPGPLKDKKVRAEVREKNLPIVEEGLKNLQKAIDVDKEYDDAMAYMNLLYRERADLSETTDEYKKDIASADSWVDKTLETKKIKNERAQKTQGGVIIEEKKPEDEKKK